MNHPRPLGIAILPTLVSLAQINPIDPPPLYARQFECSWENSCPFFMENFPQTGCLFYDRAPAELPHLLIFVQYLKKPSIRHTLC